MIARSVHDPLPQKFHGRHCGLALLNAGQVSGRAAAAGIPEAPIQASPRCSRRSCPHSGPGLPARRHAQWLDTALAAERRLEGVPPRRRAGRARVRARHEGAPVGLQRPVAGPDHRGGRRRQGAHLRHQQAARAHDGPLARPAPAQRHGRRRRPDAAAHRARQDVRLRVRSSRRAAPSCTTRTPTRWCRWRWA